MQARLQGADAGGTIQDDANMESSLHRVVLRWTLLCLHFGRLVILIWAAGQLDTTTRIVRFNDSILYTLAGGPRASARRFVHGCKQQCCSTSSQSQDCPEFAVAFTPEPLSLP